MSEATPVRVIATAGHVDHGKSTLVRLLTGTDPDRWAEEKARGLTIDLGFAAAVLPSGATASFVDVPGHTRFLKNMLAGVGAVSACLFVVAATEGWKPQSEEHLRILDLLGVHHGLVVLTKVDLVDADHLELARMEVADHLAGSFLADAPILTVDGVDGTGRDELVAALDRLVAATPPAPDRGRPRLWIDRSFAPRGAGTVVTGTLADGGLAVDDEVDLLPSGARARVRGLQTLHHAVPAIGPGHRVAVNLSGVDHGELGRGDVVVTPGRWHRTDTVDAHLHVLASLDHAVSRRGAHVLHLGAGEFAVRVRILGSEALAPGAEGPVRLHLPHPLPLLPGDRFVLRESGRGETIGGGEILDVEPRRPAAGARPDRSVARVVAERGWVDVEHLERITGEHRPPDVGVWVVAPEVLAAARAEVLDAVAGAGRHGLDLASLDERRRAVLDTLEQVVVAGGRARPADAADDRRSAMADHPWLVALEADPFLPPDPTDVDPADVRELVRLGLVVRVDKVWFAASALEEAARRLAARLADRPEGLSVAEVREVLGSTRKYVIPLLGHFDTTGRTRRRGDLRIAGPRLTRGGPG